MGEVPAGGGAEAAGTAVETRGGRCGEREGFSPVLRVPTPPFDKLLLFCFTLVTGPTVLEPYAEWYKSLPASNTSQPRNHCTFL